MERVKDLVRERLEVLINNFICKMFQLVAFLKVIRVFSLFFKLKKLITPLSTKGRLSSSNHDFTKKNFKKKSNYPFKGFT